MMKILAGVEQLSEKPITDINDQHAHNNNSHEKLKPIEEAKTEKQLLEQVSFFLFPCLLDQSRRTRGNHCRIRSLQQFNHFKLMTTFHEIVPILFWFRNENRINMTFDGSSSLLSSRLYSQTYIFSEATSKWNIISLFTRFDNFNWFRLTN